MTYNEKESLYESIMKDVAKIVKRQINESNVPNDSDYEELVLPTDKEGKFALSINSQKVREIKNWLKKLSEDNYGLFYCIYTCLKDENSTNQLYGIMCSIHSALRRDNVYN